MSLLKEVNKTVENIKIEDITDEEFMYLNTIEHDQISKKQCPKSLNAKNKKSNNRYKNGKIGRSKKDYSGIFVTESNNIISGAEGSTISIDGDEIITVEGSSLPVFETTEDGIVENIIDASSDGVIITGNIDETLLQSHSSHIISEDGEVITVDGELFDENELSEESFTEVDKDAGVIAKHNRVSIKKKLKDELDPTVQIEVQSSDAGKTLEVLSSSVKLGKNKNISRFLLQKNSFKVDKNDPHSRLHYVKYMKRDGKTVKLFECGICWKEFVHRYTLMRHLPTHTDERNFECNQCGKKFRQMSTLSQHKATHSESRPYVCDVCRKTFSRVSTLISHKKTHSDDKQHICYICNKAFHQKGNLKNHLFTHTNERPYKCETCGRGFNQASNLHCHRAKAHLDGTIMYQYATDKFKCNMCDASFAKKIHLLQHEKYKHGIAHVVTKDKSSFLMNVDSVLKRKKIGNVRIIQLPNGDRTFQEIDTEVNTQLETDTKGSGILIDPIDTKAMHQALAAGHVPFALLKPTKGVPVVVKVQFAAGSKHMLVPASADELRTTGKFTVSNPETGQKAVQIKVPVVATIIQRVDETGQVHMDIEAPENAQGNPENGLNVSDFGISNKETLTSNHGVTMNQEFVINPSVSNSLMEGEEVINSQLTMPMLTVEDGIVDDCINASESIDYTISEDAQLSTVVASESSSSVNLLSTDDDLVTQEEHSLKDTIVNVEGVQYLKQSTTSLSEYEMVTADDPQATHIINQGQILPIKQFEDEGNTMTMDQEHMSVLMDALQTAGYQLQDSDSVGENHQIIINSDGTPLMVDNHMVIDGDIESVIEGDIQGVAASDDIGGSSINLVVHEVPEALTYGVT